MDKVELQKLRDLTNKFFASGEKDYMAFTAKEISALLDHIDALEERLFGALQTDKVLKIAVREVDHASHMSRSVVSDVIDLACVQKARIDALEGQVEAGDRNYISAVNGRKDFRQAYRESRDIVNKLKSPTDEMWNTVWQELSDHKFYAVCKALSIDQIRSLFEMFHQNMVKAAIASAVEGK